MWHHFTYLTARFAAVTKRNVHWVALKHRLNTWTLAHFYYVDIGTYCCIFMKLLQKRNAAGSEFIYPGSFPKMNALSCWKYTLHQTQNLPESVNKCKTYLKMYLLMQLCHFKFIICRFELLCQTVITLDLNRSSTSLKYVSVLCELLNKLTVYENP